jgi:hypothetical protein
MSEARCCWIQQRMDGLRAEARDDSWSALLAILFAGGFTVSAGLFQREGSDVYTSNSLQVWPWSGTRDFRHGSYSRYNDIFNSHRFLLGVTVFRHVSVLHNGLSSRIVCRGLSRQCPPSSPAVRATRPSSKLRFRLAGLRLRTAIAVNAGFTSVPGPSFATDPAPCG